MDIARSSFIGTLASSPRTREHSSIFLEAVEGHRPESASLSTSPSRRVSPLSGRVGRCGRVAARLFLHGNRARSGEPSTSGRQLSDDKRRVTAGGVTVTLAGEKGARGDSRALLFTRSFVTEPYLHTPPERERTPLRLTATR